MFHETVKKVCINLLKSKLLLVELLPHLNRCTAAVIEKILFNHRNLLKKSESVQKTRFYNLIEIQEILMKFLHFQCEISGSFQSNFASYYFMDLKIAFIYLVFI